MIKGPGIKKGEELKKQVRLIDIAPTISYLLGIPSPSNSEGRVLYEILG
jgi:arylsulfatase A-like enzyme